MNNTEYKAEQAVYTKKLERRVIYNRHSLHFIFVIGGKLLYFEWASLLTLCSWLATLYTIVGFIFNRCIATFANALDGFLDFFFPCFSCKCRVLSSKVKHRWTRNMCSIRLFDLSDDKCRCLCKNCECCERASSSEYEKWIGTPHTAFEDDDTDTVIEMSTISEPPPPPLELTVMV